MIDRLTGDKIAPVRPSGARVLVFLSKHRPVATADIQRHVVARTALTWLDVLTQYTH